MEQDIINNYTQQSHAAQQEADNYKKLSNTYSLYRLGIFGLFILSVCVAISLDDGVIIGLALAVLIVTFGWLVKKQNHFDSLKTYFQELKRVSENEISSMQNHANMYDNGSMFVNDKHYYTSDLDIFGVGSLFQLVNRCATFPGTVKLAGCLHEPADKSVILLRQGGVKEIAKKMIGKLISRPTCYFL